MMQWVRFGTAAVICGGLAGCSLPRSAPFEQEILRDTDNASADFAVYPVTGEFLPILEGWPRTEGQTYPWIAADAASPAPRGQIIAPGDTLNLMIWDSTANSLLASEQQRTIPIQNIRVAPDGTIFVPYIGDTLVAGMSPQTARVALQEAMDTVVPSVQIQLALTEGRGNSVDLVGGVGAPGTYPMPDRSFTVLSLISQGGGVSPDLQNPQIRLIRDGRIYGTSISQLYGAPRLDIRLQGGDRVIVEQDKRYFLSLGATGVQAQHSFNRDTVTALDALAIIGGVSASLADPQGVLILREYDTSTLDPDDPGPRQQRVVFALDLTKADGLFSARSFHIASGDLVLATESPVTSVQTVLDLIGSILGLGG
ncbi:MAG: polysaccharide export protein [Rhodobacteraceae bacterium]|nr:polysaccharide export protein [Paracoccaceae bacterium]